MKYALKNIRTFWKEDKLTLFLLVICAVVSSLVINYSAAVYQNYSKMKNDIETDVNEIMIRLHNNENCYATIGSIKEMFMSFPDRINDSVTMYYAQFECTDIPYDRGGVSVRFCIKNDCIVPCHLFEENLRKWGNFTSGVYFSDQQEINGECVALIHDDRGFGENSIYNKLMIDETHLQFMGKKYELIGMEKLEPLLVPVNSLNDDIIIDAIAMDFSSALTRSMYDDISEIINNSFEEIADIPDLEFPDIDGIAYSNTLIIVAVMLCTFSAISFSVIYSYLLSKRKKSLLIYRLCGCKKIMALKIYLEECMIVMIPSYIVGSVVFLSIVLRNKNLLELDYYRFELKDFIMMFFIYLIVSMCGLTMMIYHNCLKHSIKRCGV
ncbi:FtsX-like permease family protein [Ruminococcus sp. HUN007]|uniref:FtsX-like permease family protein n=1 Tax=Ruminococcus sp. HUN007 TaxID=1514668 RepID=UPI0005D1358A|nr:FtsX-like permease family protein [Ruminococcus sp. HUN007]